MKTGILFLICLWAGYEGLYRLFVPEQLLFSCYSGFFLRASSDNTRTVIFPVISEFASMAIVQLLQYIAEGVAPKYYVGSLHVRRIEGKLLLR